MTMKAREEEDALLQACVSVALGRLAGDLDQRRAVVMGLAASLLGQGMETYAERLEAASEKHLLAHAQERVAPDEVVRRGWVISLPRFRDMLGRELSLMGKA